MRTPKTKRAFYPGAEVMIAIDPGLDGTGWALWSNDESLTDTPHIPLAVGTARAPREGELAYRCSELWDKIHHQLTAERTYLPLVWRRASTYVFLEIPQHFASSARGIAAQAGAVYALAFLVGFFAAKFQGCSVIVFTPNEWKGQLPKEVVERRLRKKLGSSFDTLGIKTHAIDAVGIGMHAIGRF